MNTFFSQTKMGDLNTLKIKYYSNKLKEKI